MHDPVRQLGLAASSSSAAAAAAAAGPCSMGSTGTTSAAAGLCGASAVPDPMQQLGLVLSLTACQLLLAVCECLRMFPCTAAAWRAMDGMVRLRMQCAARSLLVGAVAPVAAAGGAGGCAGAGAGGGAAAGGGGAAGAAGRAAGGPRAEAPGEAGAGVAAAWRRQLRDALDMLRTLSGVVRLLAAYPRMHLGMEVEDQEPRGAGGVPGRAGGGFTAGGTSSSAAAAAGRARGFMAAKGAGAATTSCWPQGSMCGGCCVREVPWSWTAGCRWAVRAAAASVWWSRGQRGWGRRGRRWWGRRGSGWGTW